MDQSDQLSKLSECIDDFIRVTEEGVQLLENELTKLAVQYKKFYVARIVNGGSLILVIVAGISASPATCAVASLTALTSCLYHNTVDFLAYKKYLERLKYVRDRKNYVEAQFSAQLDIIRQIKCELIQLGISDRADAFALAFLCRYHIYVDNINANLCALEIKKIMPDAFRTWGNFQVFSRQINSVFNSLRINVIYAEPPSDLPLRYSISDYYELFNDWRSMEKPFLYSLQNVNDSIVYYKSYVKELCELKKTILDFTLLVTEF